MSWKAHEPLPARLIKEFGFLKLSYERMIQKFPTKSMIQLPHRCGTKFNPLIQLCSHCRYPQRPCNTCCRSPSALLTEQQCCHPPLAVASLRDGPRTTAFYPLSFSLMITSLSCFTVNKRERKTSKLQSFQRRRRRIQWVFLQFFWIKFLRVGCSVKCHWELDFVFLESGTHLSSFNFFSEVEEKKEFS